MNLNSVGEPDVMKGS